MSPEINGNNPPSVTKRKKNRDKKVSHQNNPIDFNMSTCNYFPTTNPTTTYQQNPPPDISHYYSFMNYTNPTEPMSLPVYPMNYPQYYPNFMSTPKMFVPPTPQTTHHNNDTEYLSLPVGSILTDNGDDDNNNDDDDDDDLMKRRYSDPGLLNDSSDSSANSIIENEIIQKLAHQVNFLKESNRKLSTQMMEMRIELNMLKQQQQQNLRHYDRDYEPGMLAEIIREVRDAARVREDALLARVKHMIEEKQLNLNHLQLVNEKNRNNDRISKIEEQLKSLTVNGSRSEENLISSIDENTTTARQVLELEREALELRRELQDTRAKKEEADQKLLQMDKKLASFMHRRNDISPSDISEDGKTNSIDTVSITTTSSSITQIPPPRVTLSGPVTDL